MRLSTRPCDCQAQWILFIGYKGAGRDRAAKDGDDSQSSQRDQPRDCAPNYEAVDHHRGQGEHDEAKLPHIRQPVAGDSNRAGIKTYDSVDLR